MEELEQQYRQELEQLRAKLSAKIVPLETASQRLGENNKTKNLMDWLSHTDDSLDELLVKYVVLFDSTPKALAEFVTQDYTHHKVLLDHYWNKPNHWKILRDMLLADGAKAPIVGRGNKRGPAQWGPALKTLWNIEQESARARASCEDSNSSVLRRLAIAIALEHAVPLTQENPQQPAASPVDTIVDPVRRYLNYEMAYLEGELDPAFATLSIWDLRMVVDGAEPDEILAWGRTMLRNYRPDHIWSTNYNWRYVALSRTNVRYGSQNIKHDRPELQLYQNTLMNGGVCGRRAFMGRFILRAFGIPTTARPSRGHGALCHWTPTGWVVNLGPGWGCGWTKTLYHHDEDFLATTQARTNPTAYCIVKRAQWIGDVRGEKRMYGEHDGHANQKGPPEPIGCWNAMSLQMQRNIIHVLPNIKEKLTIQDAAECKITTMAEKVLASPIALDAKKVRYEQDNCVVHIPAASFDNPRRTKDVDVMRSFDYDGGLQIYLPAFAPQGLTILRGGTWKSGPNETCSGFRLLSGGYGKYHDWGFRCAVGSFDDENNIKASYPPSPTMTLDLGGTNGVTMEFVYVKPGTFIMGGESTTDGRFNCVEVPKHQVQLTKGFYLGKYPVTQAQYETVMGNNPSKSTKAPGCPVDNIGEDDALEFCTKLVDTIGKDVRLPTEAEWEYSCRAGKGDTKWFFGNDPSQLGEYAWFKDNSSGKSNPVGQKKPNPWGLYDMYGNVLERVADKYAKDYYATSPPVDPTGPMQGTKSSFEYTVRVPQTGKYELTAEVVTANFEQRLNAATNDDTSEIVIEMPFTLGQWQTTTPVNLSLKKGDNKLRFWRDKPPQYGVAIKSFTLKPATSSTSPS
jgi:formylglycine-generating enzyme required for sulfatase activity